MEWQEASGYGYQTPDPFQEAGILSEESQAAGGLVKLKACVRMFLL